MEKYCAADEGMNVRICYEGVLVIIWFFQLFNYVWDVLLFEAVIYFIMDILMVEYDKVHMHVIKMNLAIIITISACLCRQSILQGCVENQVLYIPIIRLCPHI